VTADRSRGLTAPQVHAVSVHEQLVLVDGNVVEPRALLVDSSRRQRRADQGKRAGN